MLTKASLTNVKCQRSFATFQALILLSFCEVLRKRRVPYEIIDHIIEYIAKERDRRRLLNSARWINGVIVGLVTHGWTISRATELFFICTFVELAIGELELTSFSDALSLTNLMNISNNENMQSILRHFKTDEFVRHDYSDCLQPGYTIPGLIESLLEVCTSPASKTSYGVLFGHRDNSDKNVIGLMRYAPPSVTTRTVCLCRPTAHTRLRLLGWTSPHVQSTSISRSTYQAPFETIMRPQLPVRSVLAEQHLGRWLKSRCSI